MGYDIHRLQESSFTTNQVSVLPDEKCATTVCEGQFYSRWQAPHPLYTPWTGHPDFLAYYDDVSTNTLVAPERCYILLSFARYASHLKGDFAEAGVYKGGTALLVSRVLRGTSTRFYLFDSFQGLPGENPDFDNFYHQGDFKASELETRSLLEDFNDVVNFRVGRIPDTFNGLENRRFAYVHIDVDLYQTTMDCCEFFYPRTVNGGVLIFDDYGFPACRGEKEAVDQYFQFQPETPIILPTGQAIIIRTGTRGFS